MAIDWEQEIEITSVPATSGYYRSKGYDVPKHLEKFKVKAYDLKSRSVMKIIVECDKCGDKFHVRRDAYEKRKNKFEDLCTRCTNQIIVDLYRKKTIKEVRKVFKENNCNLLSKDYVNSRQSLVFIAQCGHSAESNLHNFMTGQSRLCKRCSNENKKNARKLEYNYVYKYFQDNGCTLLSKEYINAHQDLHYICVCGNEYWTDWHHFKQGNRCMQCKINNLTGENSPSWNPNLTDEDRKKLRIFPEYREWRIDVYKKDKYTCQCCGQFGHNLNAHHIKNYAGNPALITEVSNGITLCESCHMSFHKLYGKANNTKKQLDEFIELNKR